MSFHTMTMDDVMKDVLVTHAFANSTKFGNTCEDQIIRIKTDWEELFAIFTKYSIYASFINQCEQLNLNWKSYNLDRYNFFTDQWKDDIQKILIAKIKLWFSN